MSPSTGGATHVAPTSLSRRLIVVMLTAVALLVSLVTVTPLVPAAHGAGPLISQGKPVTASSVENGGTAAVNAVDGNTGTRWSSAASDPQWIQVDLGSTVAIDQVVLNWEAAYGRAYQIQVSDSATGPWTNVYSTTTGDGGVDTLAVTGSGRYVRMNGTQRATGYGYSLWEFQVFGAGTPPTTTCDTSVNAALNKPSSASSTENAGTPASAAFDSSTTTRWSSAASDPQWIQVDLGSTQSICRVVLNWEAAYGRAYQVQTSDSSTGPWTTISSTTTGDGGIDSLAVTGSGRYVRLTGTTRATVYGYSLWDVQINTGGGTTNPTTCAAQPTVPDFGPNVRIFEDSTPDATIQASLNEVFEAQKDTQAHQFHDRRDAFLFKPGSYNVYANIGFNTSIQGLSQNPDGTTINGGVTVDAFNASDAGNATQNFWRSAENLTINTNGGRNRWGVSQAAPFRRMNVLGGLDLFPASYGWSSGGYISDTRVSGSVESASQQQWYSKDSTFGSWSGSNWNMVFSGVNGAPATNFSTSPSGVHHTNVGSTPTSRDVPYIYFANNEYRLFLPDLRTNANGPSWAVGAPTPGTSVSFSQVFVARPSDSAATINARIAGGCHVVFSPGIYNLDAPIVVNRANTVLLGMGYATLVPQGGVTAISVGDVDGVRVKGMFIDAGTTNSTSLMTVGTTAGIGTSRAANPVTVQDVFFRIGGRVAGKATNSLVVNSSNTIVDHTWMWRADHGNGGTVGWTINTADTGLVVNGNNVLATGLFVEHYQKYEVIWNGQGGRIIFFQNEKPYDPPNQAAWMNGSNQGYASIKVAESVTSFLGQGLGSYVFFQANPAVNLSHTFESPVNANVRWQNMAIVSLGGVGSMSHVINDAGPGVNSSTNNAYMLSYP
ncbi:discoidin domain-containing protein [Cellulomonas edaphi]|uniref:Discoidin domain-containing protein n=1 Tax=Cellulomonas edaphi TaxID=3053468 RepID=A0ABT7SA28_9CELL|nr:discoidin domain-containing protein [Cellulomons edaphi]MDM7832488.1 discoidin domain-containing protein [Cellulomons edaphi]